MQEINIKMYKEIITTFTYNGLCNRLLNILSCYRLAKKTNRICNIMYQGPSGRAELNFFGEHCSFNDIFQNIDNVTINGNTGENTRVYEFKYWDNKDHIIDSQKSGNILINYAVYVIIDKDDKSGIFTNLQQTIKIPQEIPMDYVGNELRDLFINNFKPKPELQYEIDRIYKTFKKNMIGLHIRSTEKAFEVYNWDDIIKNIEEQCKYFIDKDPENNAIFLATDNPKIHIIMSAKLKNNLLFYEPPKFLCGITSDDKFGNDKYNVIVASIELYLLGKCNKAVIGTTDSTFSMTALIISDPNTRKFLINDTNNIPSFIDL